jgi:hypothetical protein
MNPGQTLHGVGSMYQKSNFVHSQKTMKDLHEIEEIEIGEKSQKGKNVEEVEWIEDIQTGLSMETVV